MSTWAMVGLHTRPPEHTPFHLSAKFTDSSHPDPHIPNRLKSSSLGTSARVPLRSINSSAQSEVTGAFAQKDFYTNSFHMHRCRAKRINKKECWACLSLRVLGISRMSNETDRKS